ncbi:hypothetical protein TNCV_633791 [Trichonephila clavipes]|nr:hypothetical protein TNCV_633791 [Trichonephila clavipes]
MKTVVGDLDSDSKSEILIPCKRYSKLNSVAEQPKRAKAYCAQLSIRDHWALKSRSGDQSKLKPPVFSLQAILVLIFRPAG